MSRTTFVVICLLCLSHLLAGCASVPLLSSVPLLGKKPEPMTLTIEKTEVVPSQVQPGEKVDIRLTYNIVPQRKGKVIVEEVRELFFAGQRLGRLQPLKRALQSDAKTTAFLLPIPPDAAEGTYTVRTVTTLVDPVKESGAVSASADTVFVVRSAVSSRERLVYVRTNLVTLRKGPGPNFAAVAAVPQGTELPVVGETYSGKQLWYKVRWNGIQEAWVGAQLTAARPESL